MRQMRKLLLKLLNTNADAQAPLSDKLVNLFTETILSGSASDITPDKVQRSSMIRLLAFFIDHNFTQTQNEITIVPKGGSSFDGLRK